MKKLDRDLINAKRLFNKKNIVIQSDLQLTLLEQNIFNLIQYVLTKAYKKSFSKKYYIPYHAFKIFMGTKISGISRNKIENIFEELKKKSIEFDVTKKLNFYNEINITWSEEGTYGVNLISSYDIPQDIKGCIEIEIPELIMKIIKSQANVGYTPTLLHIGKEAKNKYTPRVYDYMMNLINFATGIRKGKEVEQKISVKKFRKLVGVDDKQYTKINDLKKRVLEETKKECSCFGINFEFLFEREGRKVTNIIFKVSKDDIQKAKNYVKYQTVINDEDDVFICYARECAQIDNLKKFNDIIPSKHEKIEQILATNKPLIFKIIFIDGSYKESTFDELAEIVEYHEDKEICVNPKLHEEFTRKEPAPYISYPIEATPNSVANLSEACWEIKEREERKNELQELEIKDIKVMDSGELYLKRGALADDIKKIDKYEMIKKRIPAEVKELNNNYSDLYDYYALKLVPNIEFQSNSLFNFDKDYFFEEEKKLKDMNFKDMNLLELKKIKIIKQRELRQVEELQYKINMKMINNSSYENSIQYKLDNIDCL